MKFKFTNTVITLTDEDLIKIKRDLFLLEGIDLLSIKFWFKFKLNSLGDDIILVNNKFWIDEETIKNKAFDDHRISLSFFSDRELDRFIKESIYSLIKLEYGRFNVIKTKFRDYFLNEGIIK